MREKAGQDENGFAGQRDSGAFAKQRADDCDVSPLVEYGSDDLFEGIHARLCSFSD